MGYENIPVLTMQYIEDNEREKIVQELQERYNPSAIGELEKYPPKGEYFVTLYYDEVNDRTFTLSNRYNVSIRKDRKDPSNDLLCNFELSNIAKISDEIKITMKVTKQNL